MKLVIRTWSQSIPKSWFALQPQQVHVWLLDMDMHAETGLSAAMLLDTREIGRLKRLDSPILRHRLITRRVVLRQLLSGYLRVSAASLFFRNNSHGKPELAHPSLAPPLWFNLSYSDQYCLFAFTTLGPVGIDVETVTSLPNMWDMAHHWLTEAELRAIESVHATARDRIYYKRWTQKEAYIKAIGKGLALPMNSFAVDVSLSTNEPQPLVIGRQTGSLQTFPVFGNGIASCIVLTTIESVLPHM